MKTKTQKLFITGFGDFLSREDGCLKVRHADKTAEKYPLFDNLIGEIQIAAGNSASIVALETVAMWNIDCVFLTQNGRPLAYLKSLEDDSHVKTRIAQYEAARALTSSLTCTLTCLLLLTHTHSHSARARTENTKQ